MEAIRRIASSVVAALLVAASATLTAAAGHRDAPLTALDRPADIADVFAFRSYDPGPPRVTIVRRPIDPGEPGCTAGAGAPCAP